MISSVTFFARPAEADDSDQVVSTSAIANCENVFAFPIQPDSLRLNRNVRRASSRHGAYITHACGHEQIHYLSGLASQQERKARWLETTKCRTCFVATKQAEQAEAAVRDGAAIAHLELPLLTGSDRQVAWATSLRASRFCALVARPVTEGTRHQFCALVTDAKWWIDHRALTDTELLAEAESYAAATGVLASGSPTTRLPQAA
jgi:hypothetical protein